MVRFLSISFVIIVFKILEIIIDLYVLSVNSFMDVVRSNRLRIFIFLRVFEEFCEILKIGEKRF